MSIPRQVVPGCVYLVTRRCTQRQFLLRPDPETNNAFVYCLAYAAERAGIRVIAFLASSNHYHAVVVDSEGRIPTFLEEFHRLIAKHQNVLRGRSENMWSTQQTSLVELIGEGTILSKVVYTLGNPVKDQLVEKTHRWPGATSLRATLYGEPIKVKRPQRFFRRDGGPMPASVELRCARIPGHEDTTKEAYVAMISDELRQVEVDATKARERGGGTILGRKTVLSQSPSDRPQSHEKRRPKSTVASLASWARAEAVERLRAFRSAYNDARAAWLTGEAVLFPQGTWWLRCFAAVPCEQRALAAA